MSKLLRMALEEASDGKANTEIEHVFYARVPDRAVLEQAAGWEHQEQWEIRIPKTDSNAGNGRVRIRMTQGPEKAKEYVLTTKTFKDNGDRIEVPIPTTEDHFEQFKLLSECGMRKDRYFFPVEGTDLVWEVDMFYQPGSVIGSKEYYEWCKIDLEVADRSAPIPPLPFALEDVIAAPYGKRTPEEEAIVSKLHGEVFATRNVHLQVA